MKRKVWDITVKDNPNRVVMGENDEFYTTDTEAYLVFKLDDENFNPATAVLTLENRNDGSLKNETVDVVDGLIEWEMPQRYIEHFGNWQGQLVYEDTKDGQPELYTSAPFSFVVNAHIGDKKKPSLVEIENWEKFIRDGTELIETWEDLEALREENERQRQANEQARESAESERVSNEVERISKDSERDSKIEAVEGLQADLISGAVDSAAVQQHVEERYGQLEEEYAPRLTEVTAQLAQTDGRVDNLVLEYDIDPNKDPEIVDARKSVNTGITYDLLGQRINELEAVQMLGGELIPTDYSDTPGGKVILKGDREYGFLGFVQPEEMGKLLDNPEGSQEFNGTNLATAVGITQGTAINSNTPWMKFFSGGGVMFVPVKPLRHSVSWNSIYNAGAVYGDDTIGVNPPNGRAGNKLSVDGANSSFLIEPDAADRGFLMSGAEIASVGDTIVTRGFANEENNGEFVVSEVTDTAIKVNATLFTEPQGHNSASIYKEGDEVRQDAEVTVGKHKYKVRLLRGASQDPLDSYNDSDRDLVGPASEWNNLILPLHEQAKLQDWAYKSYAGTTEDWGMGLTDKDLVTHRTLGPGSYSWMQETSDSFAWARVSRGYDGASFGGYDFSWYTNSGRGWRPALQLNIT